MDSLEQPGVIAHAELATLLRQPQSCPPVIIDVRDSDFHGGHIRGAVNLPQDHFEDDDDVDDIVQRHRDAELIVFHCMMSQVRGPFCARRFLSRMNVVLDGEAHKPKVKILAGGFQQFMRVYRNDSDLLADVKN